MNDAFFAAGKDWELGPDWLGQRCGAKTRKGTPCQNPAMKGKARCRNHGGKSTGAERNAPRSWDRLWKASQVFPLSDRSFCHVQLFCGLTAGDVRKI